MPCIFFSGGITIGTIGRQLAMVGNANTKPDLNCATLMNHIAFTVRPRQRKPYRLKACTVNRITCDYYYLLYSNRKSHLLSIFISNLRFSDSSNVLFDHILHSHYITLYLTCTYIMCHFFRLLFHDDPRPDINLRSSVEKSAITQTTSSFKY